MALLVDGRISTVADLQAYDSTVLEAASSGGVDLEVKLGVAEQEVLIHLTAFLLKHRDRIPSAAGGEPDLSAVVVTPALRQWHTLRALALTYGDAFHGQVNDRYERKMRHFEEQARKAVDSYFETGVGLVTDPIHRARQAAILTGSVGPAAHTYAVSVAWRNNRAERGALSIPVNVTTSDGESLQILAIEPPENVNSYDVFAGVSEATLTLQNDQPVAMGTWWAMPPTGLKDGIRPGDGQQPDYWIRHERILRRG
jgi:hypothetical protein